MGQKCHFIAGNKFYGEDSGKEITWCEEQGKLFLEFNDVKVRRRIPAPEIGNNPSLINIYNIFADWSVCDYIEEQEFKAFACSFK